MASEQLTTDHEPVLTPERQQMPAGISAAEQLLATIESGKDPDADIVELICAATETGEMSDRIVADEVGGLSIVDQIATTESEKASGQTFGHGYGYAGEVVIPDITAPDYAAMRREHSEMSDDVFTEYYSTLLEEGRTKQAEAIRSLQEKSRNDPKYANKAIVPLRRGVLEFEPEAAPGVGRFGRTHRFKPLLQYSAL